ncbi:hypothetical protein [Brachybacterium vulturis]|uniref:hypothetical protein n=1 Tax=Brachybacterium vulturis TaxID=2017484 RepID=UPI00373527A4
MTATVEQAARWALLDSQVRHWNPVYRRLVPSAPAGQAAPGAAERALALRQFTAPALLTLAVTHRGSTRRLRAALSPAVTGIEASTADGPSVWQMLPVSEVPARLEELLGEAGITADAPRLTVTGPATALRPDEAQLERVRAALERGISPEEAFADLTDPDPRLRDALTAAGPRVSLSLSLHDVDGAVAERPVLWSRLWVRGDAGWYRLDADGTAVGAIHPVTPGDVLGTAVPVLEHGVRFAAACESAGSGR